MHTSCGYLLTPHEFQSMVENYVVNGLIDLVFEVHLFKSVLIKVVFAVVLHE